MGDIEKVHNLCKIAGAAFEELIKYQNAKVRKYENIEHILTEENEILVPSREESYSFDKNTWDINYTHGYIVMTKKKLNRILKKRND